MQLLVVTFGHGQPLTHTQEILKEVSSMYNRDISIGLQTLLKRAQYDMVAAYNAAKVMEQEHRGASAIQYFYERSASMGYPPAMLMMAAFYMRGDYLQQDDYNVPPRRIKDINEAVRWIKLAAKQDYYDAFYMLARCYLEGIGVKPDTSYCQYYIDRIPFPNAPANPYKMSESVVFGNVSKELASFIPRKPVDTQALALAG